MRKRRRLVAARSALAALIIFLLGGGFLAVKAFMPAGDGTSIVDEAPQARAGGQTSRDTAQAAADLGPEGRASTSAGADSFRTLSFPDPMPQPPVTLSVPILMFHHVGDLPPQADEIRTDLTVPGADFEGMLAHLEQAGYQTVTQKQLFQALFEGGQLPAKPVMLTFDDGYADNYQVGLPALERHGFTGTFYITTDFVGTPGYMTWEQLRELESRGMDIGAHTASHADLEQSGDEGLKYELADSGAALSAQLGHPVYWLCYPAGKYDERVIHAAWVYGYLAAVTTEPGSAQSSAAPFEMPRLRIHGDTGVAGLSQMLP